MLKGGSTVAVGQVDRWFVHSHEISLSGLGRAEGATELKLAFHVGGGEALQPPEAGPRG